MWEISRRRSLTACCMARISLTYGLCLVYKHILFLCYLCSLFGQCGSYGRYIQAKVTYSLLYGLDISRIWTMSRVWIFVFFCSLILRVGPYVRDIQAEVTYSLLYGLDIPHIWTLSHVHMFIIFFLLIQLTQRFICERYPGYFPHMDHGLFTNIYNMYIDFRLWFVCESYPGIGHLQLAVWHGYLSHIDQSIIFAHTPVACCHFVNIVTVIIVLYWSVCIFLVL